MRQSELVVTLLGDKMGESKLAIKFKIKEIVGFSIDPEHEEQWFPFSQVRKIFTDPMEVGKDYLVVSAWILKQKGLIPKGEQI